MNKLFIILMLFSVANMHVPAANGSTVLINQEINVIEFNNVNNDNVEVLVVDIKIDDGIGDIEIPIEWLDVENLVVEEPIRVITILGHVIEYSTDSVQTIYSAWLDPFELVSFGFSILKLDGEWIDLYIDVETIPFSFNPETETLTMHKNEGQDGFIIRSNQADWFTLDPSGITPVPEPNVCLLGLITGLFALRRRR